MSHKDDINVLSGRLHRIIGQLCELEDDLGIIYDELDVSEQTCENIHIESEDCNFFQCSECGCEMTDFEGYRICFKGGGWNYCPNCGAKVAETTTTATTSSAGWQIISQRCYKCAHCEFVNGMHVCRCISRTVANGVRGDICMSYLEVNE